MKLTEMAMPNNCQTFTENSIISTFTSPQSHEGDMDSKSLCSTLNIRAGK
jgi:hypothetical protein